MVGCIPASQQHETHGCFVSFRASESLATCLPAENFFLSNYNKIPLSFNLQVLQSEKMANLSEISIQLCNYYLSPYTIQSANTMFRVHDITVSRIYFCSIFHSKVLHHLKVRQNINTVLFYISWKSHSRIPENIIKRSKSIIVTWPLRG